MMSDVISETERQRPSLRRGRPHRLVWLALSAGILVAFIASVVLALHWPFSQECVTRSLQESFPATVTFEKFHATYFPHPGCVGENVVFRRLGLPADAPPVATIQRMTFVAHYSDLFLRPGHLARVILEDFRVQVPPMGTSVADTGWKETPSTTTIGEMDADGSTVQVARKDGKPPLRFDIRALKLTSVSRNKPFSYLVFLNNALPPGEIRAQGEFGPWNSNDPGQTPASGKYTFTKADLASFDGISGTLGAAGEFQGSLGHLETQGHIDIPDFMVKRSQHTVRVTSDYHAFVNGTNGDVTLEPVKSAFLKTSVTASGQIAGQRGQGGKTAAIDLLVQDGRIQDVLRLFVKSVKPPMHGTTSFRAHVIIPPGEQPFLKKVRLNGDFGIQGGEFAKPSTQANVDDLSARARKIKVADKGEDEDPDRVISDLAGHVELRGGAANFRDFSFQVPGASAQMHGTFNLESTAIDLHGTLKTEAELSQMNSGFKSALLKPFNGLFKKKHAGAVVPVRLVGTYQAPQAGLDVPGAAVFAPGTAPSPAKN